MRAQHVAAHYADLHLKICHGFELADGVGKFQKNHWERDIGEGLTCVMSNGKAIEKAGVNFSHVSGAFTPHLKKVLGKEAGTFAATGISSIVHPISPLVPIIHMNIRYFSTDTGDEWFGGGIDLTPHYIDGTEAKMFHQSLKEICDRYDPHFYTKFKQWADDYFFIPHRNETRGVGGIFFDHLQPGVSLSFERLLQFTQDIGSAYPLIYSQIIKNKAELPYDKEQKYWQKVRRGRYVEFNLIYDRGTKFGLESQGNIESILVSLPPEVIWEYDYTPEENSLEFQTQKMLIKNIDWINFV